MGTIAIQTFTTPYGELLLGAYADQLCLCDWRYRRMRERIDRRIQLGLQAEYRKQKSSLLRETVRQLDQYFRSTRSAFDLPLLMQGSAFQKRVWEELLKIPYGETRSYSDLARCLGDPNTVRAVGSANGANAISIIVPCHRVIGEDGQLAGYAGGLDTKQGLLELEGAIDRTGPQMSLFS